MLIYMYMYLIVAVGTHLSRLVGFWTKSLAHFLSLLYFAVRYFTYLFSAII